MRNYKFLNIKKFGLINTSSKRFNFGCVTSTNWPNTIHNVKAELAGNSMEFKTGQFAKMTSGSAVLYFNENAILATVVNKISKKQLDGLALSVDFRQSAAAIGRIPTNYFRREMQQTEQDIANSRIIDRSLRPTFFPNYSAVDDTGDSVILGVNAASAALAVSDVPLRCTVAASRIAILNNEIIVNPKRELLKNSTMNMILSGTDTKKIIMIEMDGREIDQELFFQCVNKGIEENNKIINAINTLRKKYVENVFDPVLLDKASAYEEEIYNILNNFTLHKQTRDEAINEIRERWLMNNEEENAKNKELNNIFTEVVKKQIIRQIYEKDVRCDGRKPIDLRPITIDVNVFPKLHGSACFQRGQSQVFSTVTFDSPQSAFHPDAVAQILGAQQKKSFM